MDSTWYLFSFEGRINRARMWLALLVILCWMIFLGVLVVAVSSLFGAPDAFSFGIKTFFCMFDPAAYRSLSKVESLVRCSPR